MRLVARDRDDTPLDVRRSEQRVRRWPGKKDKPYGLRLTYDFPWARMGWTTTNWYPTVTARDSALRDLHKPGHWKSKPVKIEHVER